MWSNTVMAVLIILAVSTPSWAQQGPRAHVEDGPEVDVDAEEARTPPPEVPSATRVTQGSSESRNWTTIEIVLSVAILLFGAIVLALQTFLIVKLPLAWTPSAILRLNGVTLIITGGILLVTAGYSNQQIAPVIGLLGAIAGYLLGSADKPGGRSQPGDAA